MLINTSKIVIACTPRTGSNWLLQTLANQPSAICGGEWYQPDHTRCKPAWWRNRVEETANLTKIFAPQSVPFARATVVYLYREDREAQLRSWRKASETGCWLPGSQLPPTDFPANATELIEQADALYRHIASYVISYESMVQDFDGTIFWILALAGWQRNPKNF